MEELVSVIIPAYNADKFIGECLERVLKQSYTNIEVIVMNDGSNDSTLDIAQSFAKKDNRVKVFSQENSGSSVARINGVKNATGKYILFLDSDDFFVDDAIARLVEVAKKYDTDLIKFRLQRYPACVPQDIIIPNQPDELVIKKCDFKEKVYPLFISSYNLNTNGTLMVKRECFKVEDIDSYYKLRFAEDMKLSLELFDNVSSVTFITDVLYNYFINYSSTTKSNNIDKILYNLDNFVKVYSKLYEYLKKWDMYTKENIKTLDIKVLNEIAVFYTKVKYSEDKEYIAKNKEKIKDAIYSKMVLKAIDNLSEDDFNKEYKYYESLLQVYRKEVLI